MMGNQFELAARDAWSEYVNCLALSTEGGDPSACEARRLMAVKMQRFDDAVKLRMRATFGHSPEGWTINFGNCGTKPAPPVGPSETASKYIEWPFQGSHGALGGTPIGAEDVSTWSEEEKKKYTWSEADRKLFRWISHYDQAAVAKVRAWMWEKYAEQKLAFHHRPR